MGFYRFIKNAIRFILYQMPKKWLIMIIFAMAMTFGLTQVKAVEYVDTADIDTNNLTFYEYLDIGANYFDTGIRASVGTSSSHDNRDIYLEYSQSGKLYSVAVNINEDMGNNSIPYNSSESGIELQQENNPSKSWFRVNRKWSTQKIFNLANDTKHELHINTIDRYATIDSTMYDFSSYVSDFFTNKTLYLNSNPSYKANSFKVYYIEVTNLVNGGSSVVSLHKYYPCKYDEIVNSLTTHTYNGFYDSVTGDFLVFNKDTTANFGSEVVSPLPPEPEEPTNPDYTEDLTNIDNSINNINDNITDSNVDSSAILQPDIPEDTSGVESGVNNIFTTIMNAFINIDTTQSVVLPMPFSNKTITIPRYIYKRYADKYKCDLVVNFY